MSRSPLTETIKRVEKVINYVRENLDDGEYDLFLDLLVPEPEVKPTKRGRKKSSKSASKSSRASGMAATIANNLNQGRQAAASGTEMAGPICGKDGCLWKEGDLIHDPKGGYAGYHPFVSAAPPVRRKSSTNGAGSVEKEIDQAVESARA